MDKVEERVKARLKKIAKEQRQPKPYLGLPQARQVPWYQEKMRNLGQEELVLRRLLHDG